MSTQQTSWAPATAGLVGAGILGLVLAAGAVTLLTDVPGRILVGIAAAGLIVFALLSSRARPKLAIADGTLIYRGWWAPRRLAKSDISLIRITEFRRIGRKTRLLEIDPTDDRLLVLSRWDLGTDPVRVLDALTDAGFAPVPG